MTEHRVECPERLDKENGRELFAGVKKLRPARGDSALLNLAATREMDSFGGAWLIRAARHLRTRGVSVRWEGQTGGVAEFMVILEPGLKMGEPPKPHFPWFLEAMGGGAISFAAEFRQFMSLCVDALYWTVLAPFEGRGFRFSAFVDELNEMGVRAVRIVCLMNFLMGLIIAMLSAKQVEAFGIQIYVANLIIIAFARELGAVTTAVVVSARTGAAIAAEIATMEVQEEIDALRGMGINVVQYLVSPKLLALLVALPCLTVLGMLSGTLGGALWGVGVLGFRPSIWYNQTLGAADLSDFTQGMLKSLSFAVAIALIGCHNGFRVTGGSRGVGQMTTRAVVMDIFMLICIDIVFATIFYYLLD
ncbi:MAG: ABC transporter permease [Candidatus Hydrogenedens sp.]|nr:ABC transporter permease [Candidatus Hydrogenedentota bacterium]NLF58876.1 ABC transporter permease [Candidatus Hydrogenedens sp.]